MLKNYLIIAYRNLRRNSAYTFINITGLSVGLACSILILLWVADEKSFDKFHKNYDHLYRIHLNQTVSGSIVNSDVVPYPLVEEIKNRSTGIKHVSLTNYGEGYLIAAGETKLNKMANTVAGDFFRMFSFPVVQGDPEKLFADPATIVLTESTARELFGNEHAVNKMVVFEDKTELRVVAVIKDVPEQSTFQFDFLFPFSFYESLNPWAVRAKKNWNNNSFRVFAELQAHANADAVTAMIRDLVKENNPNAPTAQLILHPMESWRLYSEFTNGKATGGKIEMVRMFTIIGIFILVIACINFMNLATARSQSRAREVGIRKSVGSRKKQLVFQFLSESIMVTAISFGLAIALVEVLLPLYNDLVGKKLSIEYGNTQLWFYSACIILITGIVSGSYPAFYLSSFKPAKVLKGVIDSGMGSVAPRKVLVTLQFGFSIFLIIGALVMYQQIMHLKSRDSGYDRENLMLIWSTTEVEKNFSSIRDELKRSGVVKSVSKSSAPITRVFSTTSDISWAGKVGDEKVGFTTLATEYEYTETMGISLIEGRDFSPNFGGDSTAVVINKAAADLMGMKEAVGNTIRMWERDWTIIGVMKDVVMDSPYRMVDPLVMILDPAWSSTISVRLEKTEDLQAAVSIVEKVFKTFDPAHPLWYRFADAEFATKFQSVTVIGKLAWIFTLLAILISSLGLFGLAAFTAEQRTKEVGIRKILGASVSSLVILISKDFSRLIVLAFLFASPLAWWIVSDFLTRYPYRINFPVWVIPCAGVGAFMLALAIVSFQALRAAMHNPVDSLKSE